LDDEIKGRESNKALVTHGIEENLIQVLVRKSKEIFWKIGR
jgi:hypothetical protein